MHQLYHGETCSEEGGDELLSVINYGRYNHICYIMTVVEVPDRLEESGCIKSFRGLFCVSKPIDKNTRHTATVGT